MVPHDGRIPELPSRQRTTLPIRCCPCSAGQVKPNPVGIRDFLARRHVGAVIVDPAYPQQWTQALAALGLKPVAVGGILLYRV